MNSLNETITPTRLLRAFRRRRSFFLVLLAAFLLLGILACLFYPKTYEATGMIQVAKDGADALGLENSINGSAASGPEDSLSGTITLETQADILKSDALALRAIKDVNLESNDDFKPKFDPLAIALGWISPSAQADPQNATNLEGAPNKRAHLLKVFSKHLKVALVPGSRLISVSYTNADPKAAAAVVNDLFKALDDYDYNTRRDQSEKAAAWVGDQMNGLREQTESLQAQVADMQKNSGIYSIGTTDMNGRSQEYSEVLDRLQQITGELDAAVQNRILKGAVYMSAKSGDGEMLSGLAGNSISGGLSSNTANALSLIQSLRTQEATLLAQLQQDQVKFGPNYTKLDEERGGIKGIQSAIHEESARLAVRAKGDYEIAQNTELETRREYEAEKAKADALNDKAIRYVIAREEAADSRSLYEEMQKRLKEAGVAAGLRSTNISVVDKGFPAATPKWPNVPIFLGAALFLGMLFSAFAAVVKDLLDPHLKDPEELEDCGIPLLGLVPEFLPAHDPALYWKAFRNTDSRFLESIQNICYGLCNSSGKAPGTILVTSALPCEGKTIFSIGMATCFAMQGSSVLLVETNLKSPRLAAFTSIPSSNGLSTVVSGKSGPEYANLLAVPNLSLLPASDLKRSGLEQLSSSRMRELVQSWRERFDVVIIDGPAILWGTGGLSLCVMADHIVQVARHRYTTLTAIRRSLKFLTRSKHAPVSAVMTDVKERSPEFSGYYGFSPSQQLKKGLQYEEA